MALMQALGSPQEATERKSSEAIVPSPAQGADQPRRENFNASPQPSSPDRDLATLPLHPPQPRAAGDAASPPVMADRASPPSLLAAPATPAGGVDAATAGTADASPTSGKEEGALARDAAPDLDNIAGRVHKAIAGLGTDEVAVYRALQELNGKVDDIARLREIYRSRFHVDMLEDIRDDFSGTELDYVLQLLGMGAKASARDIAAPLPPEVGAQRIRTAVEGAGTDEATIYSVLVPLRRDTLALQTAYQKLYGEDLRDRLVDEMSGSELEYALGLLETPYQHYLHEANERLARVPFGAFAGLDPGQLCSPEPKRGVDEHGFIYWYDKAFWEPDIQMQQVGAESFTGCKLRLLNGQSAAAAIDAMFDHQDRWHVACAQFVQIVHLYALRHTLGARLFDQNVGSNVLLELKSRQSTGLETELQYSRESPAAKMANSRTKLPEPVNVDDLLAQAPIGSRVRWSNMDPRAVGTAWQNENTVKLGPDHFAAHGLRKFGFIGFGADRTILGFGTRNDHTRREIEQKTAQETDANADSAYIAKNIYISEIEIYKTVS
jgi:hypothetical protein